MVTGKNVRYAAITATAPQSWSPVGSLGLSQTTTMGAIDDDRNGLRRDHPRQEPSLQDPEVREQAAEDESEDGAKRETRGRLLRGEQRTVDRGSRSVSGPTPPGRAGSKSACTMLWMCGMVVSVTAKGHVQCSRIHSQR